MLKDLNNLPLRTKAIAFAIALGTVPVLLIGITNYISSVQQSRQALADAKESLAATLGDKVGRFMFERYGDVQVLANLSILANPEKTSGITPQQKQATLDRYMNIYGVYDSIAVADVSGRTILQTTGEAISGLGEQDYFKAALQTKQAVISPPNKSPSNGKYYVFIASPIVNVNTNRVTGVVRTRIPVENLDAIARIDASTLSESSKAAAAAEYHLIGPDGKFFVATEKEQIGRDAKSDFSKFAQIQAGNKVASVVDIDRIDKAKQLISYAPVSQIQGMPNLNWSVILAEDTATLYAGEWRLLLNLLLGTGITALLASALAVVFANRTTKLIQAIATSIASSSTEIAATVEQQERTVSQQASSVSQTTTTMEELGASSRQSAEQAEASTNGASQALNLAEKGTQSVHQTLTGMTTLKEQVNAIAQQIIRLSEQTGQIGSVSSLVGNLANQTNMLALNAAVEAARAGENGKGFGVVAGEIRKLADQSKKSSEKINTLVADIQAAINTTVMVTDEGTKKVDRSMELTQGTAQIFTGVADSVNNVFLNSQQISLSAKQQAIAVQQVVAAMNSINLGAKESASGITQVKTSTQQLKDAAQILKTVV
ncbi:methyl-accepting chemotaxis protein [Aliterella atlantica]|uniref:Chemotaxis protein n=1 Tax=Aliterella atlantica CENA595 TaxID=1618023 RepID=A0A0D8ZRD5_9CYAN|nr:methyl-accepting chemotaxis protein [Aliterella atlantica]KJH71368.1 chemotaxis protein [Aliterella atlantica CENA595]